MRLYLVQHGEAKSKDIDPERRLTENGLRELEGVVKLLVPVRASVASIWHSGKPRARQTAEILSAAVSTSAGVVERQGLAPKDAVSPTRQAIEAQEQDLMVIGHLPFLGKLAALLLTGEEGREVIAFRYGCVVCLERQEGGPWRIRWMVEPGLLGGRY
jgi:phosphohistidine phosphatase